jgi:hypothetical protein
VASFGAAVLRRTFAVRHTRSSLAFDYLILSTFLLAGIILIQNQVAAQTAGTRTLPDNLRIMHNNGNVESRALVPADIARGNDLYCAGFINSTTSPNYFQIVGAELENTRKHFAQGDVVYLNAGSKQSIEEGMLFSVARPRGNFRSQHGKSKNDLLGVYTSELGVLKVISVQEESSAAKIIFSCDEMQLGDQLRAFEERQSPKTDISMPLPRYKPTSGEKEGRIVYQRHQRELLSPRDVVYIDLGSEKGVKKGDKFTIFRKYPDNANPVRYNDDDIVLRGSEGYQSNTYKGGKFSNDHPYEARQKVKNNRKEIPRTIIGELVVISVQGKSATAVITRTTQEVHTGDPIEALQ